MNPFAAVDVAAPVRLSAVVWMPPAKVEVPVPVIVSAPAVSAPIVALLEKRFVEDAVVLKREVVVAPVATILPKVCKPVQVLRSARSVEDAELPPLVRHVPFTA